ncbi:hypothetical protein SESBI_18670 [Sesbania bispinosa]|nr:hypothetical protein SESBI_18670 [Sesbania bispinosa]
MAGAEARALWQRTANRCFVQEDAKELQSWLVANLPVLHQNWLMLDPANTADESDRAAVNVTYFNRKSSFSNLSPDTRWWLHSQPNYGKNSEAFPELMDVMEKHEKMEIDSIGCSVSSKQTNDFSLESDYSWIEGDKAEPWWRTTVRDELASFVSQKSLNHIENCDLPPPKKKHFRGHPCASISDDKIKTVSYDWEAKSKSFSNLTAHTQGSLDSGVMHKKQVPSANEGLLYFASDKSSSYTPLHEDVRENQQIFVGDSSKVQLMEALCHSQTRAREAEEAAKKAYAEKEHIVALIFKQASQLFAYKQWFQLLQLETLCSQIKNKDQPISTLFPVALPWMSYEGLSLVGAGLLLGWTVGWMLPRP